jgi:hypothetical protein
MEKLSNNLQHSNFVTNKKNMWKVSWTLDVIISPPCPEIVAPQYGQIYIVTSHGLPPTKQYEMTIKDYLACNFIDFKNMMV